MGPKSRMLGEVLAEDLIWQDLIPATDHALIDDADVASLKADILGTGLSVSALVGAAWASAATYRGSDKRGGANGARVRLTPQRDWQNQPHSLVSQDAAQGQAAFNVQTNGKQVSMADLIVLGGAAAIEEAARRAGHDVTVPFSAGRGDAAQEQTDIDSFAVLEPLADGFRNYLQSDFIVSAEELLFDKAHLMTLTAPEMTALVMACVSDANVRCCETWCLHRPPETLTNDFFVNSDMGAEWKPAPEAEDVFEAVDRKSGEVKWTGPALI